MIKITVPNGNSLHSTITDAKTGANLGDVVEFSALDIRLRPNEPATATVEISMIGAEVDVENPVWMVKHPITGKLEPLALIVFADGASVAFHEDGNVGVGQSPPQVGRDPLALLTTAVLAVMGTVPSDADAAACLACARELLACALEEAGVEVKRDGGMFVVA
jgi:hypothetical protein